MVVGLCNSSIPVMRQETETGEYKLVWLVDFFGCGKEKNWNTCTIGRIKYCTVAIHTCMEVPQTIKNRIIIQSNKPIPGYLPKRNENKT